MALKNVLRRLVLHNRALKNVLRRLVLHNKA